MSGSARPSSWRRAALPALLPLGAALLVFSNTIPGDFVFDDAVVVQDDARLRALDLHRIFRENYWGTSRQSPNYRPLTLLSFALNFRISDRPWAFHAVNVVLGALAVGAFYLVARRILMGRWMAAGAATLYAVLPIHAEAVANIVGRAEVLAAISVFIAWWLALRAEGRGSPGGAALVASVVLLGMLCKENAAVAALLIPLSVYLLRKRIPWALGAAALVGAGLSLLLARLLMVGAGPGLPSVALVDNPLAHAPAPARVLNALDLLGLYGLRTVFPFHLSADHSYNELPVLPAGSAALWLGAGGAALAYLVPIVLFHRRSPALALAWAVFPAAFAATANVVFPIGTIFAERLAFLPSAGYPLALAAALEAAMEAARGAPASAALRRASVLGLTALTVVYGARTWSRNEVWSDAASFNIRLARESPGSSRAHTKAAEGYLLLSRRTHSPEEKVRLFELARSEVVEALRIYPPDAGTRALWALILMDWGRLAEAQQALDEAEAAYSREGVERDPQIDFVRGEIHLKLGRYEEARRSFDAYLERRRATPAALNLRGVCRMQTGMLPGAGEDFDAAIALDPRNVNVLLNRGILSVKLGREEDARRDFDAAVALAPGDPQVYSNRGFFRFRSGDLAGAMEDYHSGLQACARDGLLAAPSGESVLAFRRRIFETLLASGDRQGARREIDSIRALPSPLAEAAARDLEARLGGPEEGQP